MLFHLDPSFRFSTQENQEESTETKTSTPSRTNQETRMNNNWRPPPLIEPLKEMRCCVCRFLGTVCEYTCPFYLYFPPGGEQVFTIVNGFFGIDTFITIFNMARDRDDAARTLIRDACSSFENSLAASCPQIISRLIREIILDRQELDYYRRAQTTQGQPIDCSAAAQSSSTINNTAGVPAMINPQHFSYYNSSPVHHVQQQGLTPDSFRGTLEAQNSSTSRSNVAVQAHGNYHAQANYARQNVQESQDNTRLGASLNLPGQQRQWNLHVNNFQNVGGRPINLNVRATAPSASASVLGSAPSLPPLLHRDRMDLDVPTPAASASRSSSRSSLPLLDWDSRGSVPKQD